MEVFIQGAPARITENQFSQFIRPHLSALNIHDWQCQKRKQKRQVILLIIGTLQLIKETPDLPF